MNITVIFHDRSSGRLKLGVMSELWHDGEMMARLPTAAAVKIGTMDDGQDAPIEVAVGGAARFYLDNGPSYNAPRDGYWDIYTEQTGHQFCLGEVRRPRTWEELVGMVRAMWATIPEWKADYQRQRAAGAAYAARYAQEKLDHMHDDNTDDDDFTDDEETAVYARARRDAAADAADRPPEEQWRMRRRRNSDMEDNDV